MKTSEKRLTYQSSEVRSLSFPGLVPKGLNEEKSTVDLIIYYGVS